MTTDTHQINHWLQAGITAAKAGEMEQARFRLLDVVEQDQSNETAWYWLYQVFDRRDDQRICLENLILLNPDNDWAKLELLKLLEMLPQPAETVGPERAGPASTPQRSPAPARPVTLKLIIAFWLGISLIFLSGGIISAVSWMLLEASRAHLPLIWQLLELLIGLAFMVTGLTGIYVAIMLFLRSMQGFYGSIALALVLLLIGPTTSLIVTPPNYISMVCTGGISGMIMLLTLASQPGFEKSTELDR